MLLVTDDLFDRSQDCKALRMHFDCNLPLWILAPITGASVKVYYESNKNQRAINMIKEVGDNKILRCLKPS